MADKKKPTKKDSAAATGAVNKTAARARTGKAGKKKYCFPKVSSRPRRAEEEIGMLKHSIDVHYDGAYWIDSDNTFVYVNDAGCKALGYTREELIGKTIYEVNSKVTAGRMKEVWAGYQEGGSFSAESVHRRKDGSEFPVDVVNTYIRFGGKKYICGFARDITERSRVEQVLLDSEMRYRTLFEQSGDYILVMKIGKDGFPVIMDMNEAALRAHGYSREEMVGRPIAFLDPVTDLHNNDERMKALKKGELELFTTQHRRKDGSLFDVEVRAQLIRISGEQVIVSTERDITERKKAEEALRESEQRISETLEFNNSILNTSSIGILTYNAAGQCVFANEANARIVGTNVAGLLSQNFHQLQSWKKSGMYEAALKALNTGIEQQMETHVVTTFGKDIWISLRFSSFNSHGEKHLLVFTYDITERTRAEEALGESQKLLETIIDAAPT